MNEDRILEWLRARARDRGLRPRVGIGDDAAVLEREEGRLVITSDAMAEGVHFDPALWSWEQVGEKLLASALSDVQAMGGVATGYLVTLGLPEGTPMGVVEGVVRGQEKVASAFELTPIGGDTVRSTGGVFLDVTVVGRLAGDPVRRRGARPGDGLFLTGGTGLSAWALERLRAHPPGARPHPWEGLEGSWDESERKRRIQQNPEAWSAYLTRLGLPPEAAPDVLEAVQRLLAPRPPRLLPAFFRAWGPTSAIDVSDGLSRDLRRLAREGGVGFQVREEELLALSPALVRLCGYTGESPLAYTLQSGEEYALLFTSRAGDGTASGGGASPREGSPPPEGSAPRERTGRPEGPPLPAGARRVGRAAEGGIVLVTRDGAEVPFPAGGYEHRF
jgi:thiamine-monophosphate kinase